MPVQHPVVNQSEPDAGDLRARALNQLKKRREFATHLLVYVLVNLCVVAIWLLTSTGFFWPIFVIAFWGIGLALNAWDVWHGESFTDAQVAREMDRLRGKF